MASSLQTTSPDSNLHSNDLIDTFLLEMWETLSQVQNLSQQLQSNFSTEVFQELGSVFHKIKGTAALYQFKQISSLANLMERFSNMSPTLTKGGQESFFSFLEQVMACLRSAFENISKEGKEANLGLNLTALGGKELLLGTLGQTSFDLATQDLQDTSDLPFVEELKLYGQNEKETLEYFVPEAREHLESLEATLFALKQGQEEDEKEAINKLFRAVHTLKGAAYMVELNPLGDVSHVLEELMVRVRDEGMPFDDSVKQTLDDGANTLGLLLDTTLGDDVDLVPSLQSLKAELSEVLGDSTILPFVPESVEAGQDAAFGGSEESQSAFLTLVQNLEAYGQEEKETLEYFVPEALEHIANIDEALLALGAADQGDFSEDSEKLFRAAHTLKGAAAMVELEPLAEVAHGLEELSSRIREDSKYFDDQVQQSLFEGASTLKDMLYLLQGEDTSESEFKLHLSNFQASLEDLLDEPPQILKPEPAAQAVVKQSQKETATSSSTSSQTAVQKRSSDTIRVSVDKLDKLLDLVGNLVNARGRLSYQMTQFAEVTGSLDSNRERLERVTQEFESQYLNPQLTDAQALSQNEESKPNQSQLATTVGERFAELEFDTYNDLNILTRSISEMADDIGELQRQIDGLKQGLDSEVEGLQTLSRSLRTQVSRARMVPIAQLFARLSRLLRQSDSETTKDFSLEVSGENVEIDNSILEALAEPLLHLVRNSLIHGIEDREQRLLKGKDPQGKLTVGASYRGNNVIITVEDDGAGINVGAVKAKAIERGLLSVKEAEQLSPEEAMELIFLAGLSTAEKVTTEAGRGVGMDAVANTVRELKGNVSLSSEIDKGTRFVLTLPLTLIISEVLLFKVARETMAFPIEAIYALQSLVPEKRGDSYYINYEGKEFPIYSVHELLALDTNFFEGKKEVSVLFLRTGKDLFAVAIDEFLSLEEVVIKPLNDFLRQLYYLSGTTVITTGEVILMLDPTGLQNLTQLKLVGQKATTIAAPQVQTKRRLLLVDDSLSVRKVLSKKLSRLGFDIITASDGQEALDVLLSDSNFDAVLTDLEMPRLNGYELVESVRRRRETAELPVIVMTTRARQEHMNLAFELGANDYLTKPVDETKLIKRLEEYL